MKFLLGEFITICIALLVITQVLIPLFVPNMEMWWSFKKKKKAEPPIVVSPTDLREKVVAKQAEVADLRDTVNSYHKEAEEIKKESEKI